MTRPSDGTSIGKVSHSEKLYSIRNKSTNQFQVYTMSQTIKCDQLVGYPSSVPHGIDQAAVYKCSLNGGEVEEVMVGLGRDISNSTRTLALRGPSGNLSINVGLVKTDQCCIATTPGAKAGQCNITANSWTAELQDGSNIHISFQDDFLKPLLDST